MRVLYDCESLLRHLWLKFLNRVQDWRSLLVDGLHFNVQGAKLVASLLALVLDPIVEGLPYIFPDKEQIDYGNVRRQIEQWNPTEKKRQ